MKTIRFSWALSALVMSLAAGCPGTVEPPLPGTAELDIVGSSSVRIPASGMAELRVFYHEVGEIMTPIPDSDIEWTIEGTTDATLSVEESTTDENGEATNTIRAGGESSFRVVATPVEGDPVSFSVTVEDFEAGSLVIDLEYSGDRAITPVAVSLHRDLRCETIDPFAPLPTAVQMTTVADPNGSTAFANIETFDRYAVIAIGQLRGEVGALGCVDRVSVDAGRETSETVTLMDVSMEPRVEGVYELQNEIDFSGSLPPSIDLAVGLLDEITDDNDVLGNPETEDFGQDPAAFLLDFAMRQTCRYDCEDGESFSDCSQLNHDFGDIRTLYLENLGSYGPAESRFTGGCTAWEYAAETAQNYVNGLIEDFVPGFVLAFTNSVGDLARTIQNAEIISRMTIGANTELGAPMQHELQTMIARIRNLDGEPQVIEIDLREAGFRRRTTDATVTITEEGLVMIPEHSFTLSYGELIQYLYLNALLPALGYDSTAELLGSLVNCDSVATWVADNVSALPITEDQVRTACNAGLGVASAQIDTRLGSLVTSAEGTITLMGSAVGADYDTAMIAQSLEDGMWMGMWGEGEDSGAITGEFTGERTGDAPSR